MDWQIRSLPVAFSAIALVLLATLVVSVPVALAGTWLGRRDRAESNRPEASSALLSCVALAFVGGLAGHLGGGSRESAVGDVVPAILALVGAYGAYVLGEKRSRSPYLLMNGLSFVLGFFVVYVLASTWRQQSENREFCFALYSDADFAAPDRRADRDLRWGTFCQKVFDDATDPPA